MSQVRILSDLVGGGHRGLSRTENKRRIVQAVSEVRTLQCSARLDKNSHPEAPAGVMLTATRRATGSSLWETARFFASRRSLRQREACCFPRATFRLVSSLAPLLRGAQLDAQSGRRQFCGPPTDGFDGIVEQCLENSRAPQVARGRGRPGLTGVSSRSRRPRPSCRSKPRSCRKRSINYGESKRTGGTSA